MPFGITAGIGAATSLAGGIFGSKAASKAANQQQQAATQAGAQLNQTVGQINPAITGAAQAGGTGVTNAAGVAGAGATTAAGNAASLVNNGTANANGTLAGILGLQAGTISPYLNLGTQGTGLLSDALQPGGSLSKTFNWDPNNVQNTQDYQFTMQQAMQALQRSQTAQGTALSGGALKAAARYAGGVASQGMNEDYGRALNTFQTNRTNTLQNAMSAIGVGMQGTGMFNQAAENYGNQAAGNTLASAMYGANTGINAAQYAGNMGYNAAQYAGNLGYQGAVQTGNNSLQAAMGVGNYLTQAGNARAAGTMGAANAWTGALSGIGGAAMGYGIGRSAQPSAGTGSILPPLDMSMFATPTPMPAPYVGAAPGSLSSATPYWIQQGG